jgi:hypothetical protein
MMQFGFLTALTSTKVREASSHGRAAWKLLTELAYHSRVHGIFVVPAGFVTDYASVPRVPFAFWLTGDTAHASAVVHDYLVRTQYAQCRMSWAQCTEVFSEAMKDEGVPAWRRIIMAWAVAGADPANKWDDE